MSLWMMVREHGAVSTARSAASQFHVLNERGFTAIEVIAAFLDMYLS